MGAKPERSAAEPSDVESALRHLGRQTHGVLVDLIEHAIDRPHSENGGKLAPLAKPAGILFDWTAAERAGALWRIILEGVEDPDVSGTAESRRRRTLYAAFRLPDKEIPGGWGSSLSERFKQLRVLRKIFNEPTSTQPMEDAWRRGVKALARHLEDKFGVLQTPTDWEPYRQGQGERPRPTNEAPADWLLDDGHTVFRQPSRGAQPVFVNLFVTTVFMRKRAVYRRITERLVTARADGVEYYTARGFAGKAPRLRYVPVLPLWGCRAEFITPERGPAVTRLFFPAPLKEGEQAHFASEVIDENVTEERYWIDVDIDHYGIASGRSMYGGRLPVSGLTIRVKFDQGYLPEAVWWYAELNESERYDPPPAGDRHLVPFIGNDVQYTFADQPCQPRESYGLAFKWTEG